MTTTTAVSTWPTTADLDRVSTLVAEAHNALDRLYLDCFQLENALNGENPSKPVPSLAQLGDLSRFIEWTAQDVEGMQEFLESIRGVRHTGAIAMESHGAS
jgi:hypothetical protein